MHDEVRAAEANPMAAATVEANPMARATVEPNGVPAGTTMNIGPAGPARPHIRLWHGMRRPANWMQLVRFGLVGAIGFVVNLAVYALLVRWLGVDYRVASVASWLVAVVNNFVINRHWTFDARAGRIHFQAVRFLLVSLAAEAVSLLILTALVEGADMRKVPAQAIAVLTATPLNFLGNKLWSFRA
jgi:putative flippase GtrA